VVGGLVFMLRSLGMAFSEVVIALLDRPRSLKSLRDFALLLIASTTFLMFAIAATPLSELWFERVSGLRRTLSELGAVSLWFALPLPGLTVLQSYFQGIILHTRRTRAVTEAVVIFLVVTAAVLGFGVSLGAAPGLYVGWTAFSLGAAAQNGWLWLRSREARRRLGEGLRPAEG
jgi:hypothetical protein